MENLTTVVRLQGLRTGLNRICIALSVYVGLSISDSWHGFLEKWRWRFISWVQKNKCHIRVASQHFPQRQEDQDWFLLQLCTFYICLLVYFNASI